MHTAMLHGLVRGGTAAAIAQDRVESVEDPRIRALAIWALGTSSGATPGPGGAPFPPEHAPELIAVAVLFHYLNRMVNVFLGPAPLPPGVPARALRPVTSVLTRLIKAAALRVGDAGASLYLLPPAPLPDDMAWVAGDESLAQAFARSAAVIEAVGARSVPPRVRELVQAEVAAWDGLPKGLSRGWVEDAISVLPEHERGAGRLALLTALASYQVDESAIEQFRAQRPEDDALVELTSWASMTAARNEAARLRTGQTGGAGDASAALR
jgi:hypothetical protein